MIQIINNEVIITLAGTKLIQTYNPKTGQAFQTEADCFNWITESGWFDRLKKNAIEIVKERTTQKIYQIAPNFKQVNAALGLCSQDELTEIVSTIEVYRTQANNLEQTILNATSLNTIISCLNTELIL